ncbi:MAG: PAC2 family protein [Deltaproteobacteria bacterium]|nr:PAC2 family protein [Deltaproteobacteria bacterium]
MTSGELVVYERPNLFRPWLIGGYKGWIDAGEVSSGSVTFLRENLRARRFAEIRSDGFYQFGDSRPTVVVESGIIRRIDFPKNEFFYWKNTPPFSDIILFLGHEPHLRWKAFTNLVLRLAGQFRVERLVTIGGLYDQVPHTVARKVSVVASNTRLLEELIRHGVDLIDYAGPGGHVSVLHRSAEVKGIDSFMLWGRVPHYLQMRSPTDSLRILELLSCLVPFEIDLDMLREDALLAEQQIQRAVDKKPELQSYIKQLESTYAKATEGARPSDQVIVEAVITRDDRGDKP